MSFPLIINPSPTQQLADVIAGIRARNQSRQRGDLENRLLNQQIVSGKMADQARVEGLDLERQRIVDARKAADVAERDRLASQALDQARFQATVQQQQIENRRAQMQRKDQLMSLLLRTLPDGVSLSLPRLQQEASGNRYLPGTTVAPPTLEQDIATAQAAARTGRQGSEVRDPRFGSSNGVTVNPGTLNSNQPAASSVGGNIAERTAIGAGLMERVVRRANQLYSANAQNAYIPVTGDVGAAIAERTLGHGAGTRVADRVRNLGASQQQIEFRGLREQFKHSMAVFFPRVSQALMDNLADSYFPVAGEQGPAAAAKVAALNDVLRVVREVRAGRAHPGTLAQTIAAGNPAAGQAFLDAAGSETPDAASPTINPRFLQP